MDTLLIIIALGLVVATTSTVIAMVGAVFGTEPEAGEAHQMLAEYERFNKRVR